MHNSTDTSTGSASEGSDRLTLMEIDPAAMPPLALYQSPWTFSMAIAFLFQGAGTYFIDDIDNAGVERGKEERTDFDVIRKEILSKKGWTNCRPLSAFCPDGLLFANLGRANFRSLDQIVPLSVLARHKSTKVEHLIRDSSRNHGMWTLVGPDRAITGTSMESAAAGIRRMTARHEEAIFRTLPRQQDREEAFRRLRHLMPDPGSSDSLLTYFQECLARSLRLVGSDAQVLSAARDLIPPDGGRLLPRFADQDPEAIAVYNKAAAIQGSRPVDSDHPLPYYTVGLRHGERVDLVPGTERSADQIVAPKILALEGVAHMALPMSVASGRTIMAREYAYRGLGSGSSQTFFESNWLGALAACTTEVNVDETWRPLVGNHSTLPLGELVQLLTAKREEYELSTGAWQGSGGTGAPGDLDTLWAGWVLGQTLDDFTMWHYPLLTYVVAGEPWLEALELRSYAAYGPA
jgi:hypothetical protein